MSELAAPSRQFAPLEITSDLPADSRAADERAAEWQLHDPRGRVKRARAVVSSTLELAETIQRDWRKAAQFYARFGITERQFRNGVALIDSVTSTSRPI